MAIYARISSDHKAVVSYPVFHNEVCNDPDPSHIYLPVKSAPLPNIPEFYYEEEVLVVKKDHVYKYFNIKAIPIDQLFNLFPKNFNQSELPAYSSLIRQIGHLTELHFITYMNELVRSKYPMSYTDLQSSLSWILNKDEAPKHLVLREYYRNTGSLIKSYFRDVELGREVLPKSIEDINSKIPEFKWPD